MLRSSQRPDEALAQTSVMLVRRLNQSSTTPTAPLLRAAMGEVIEMLAEVSQALGLFEVDESMRLRAAQRVREMLLN